MQKVLTIVWRLVLAAGFLLAAWGKMQSGVNRSPFPETIYDRVVGQHEWLHYTLVGVEVTVGVWLLTGWKPRWAAGVVLVMMLGFCVLIGREMLSPDPLGCGCGLQPVIPGRGPEVVRQDLMVSLARDVVMLLGAAYVMVMSRRHRPAGNPDTAGSAQA